MPTQVPIPKALGSIASHSIHHSTSTAIYADVTSVSLLDTNPQLWLSRTFCTPDQQGQEQNVILLPWRQMQHGPRVIAK